MLAALRSSVRRTVRAMASHTTLDSPVVPTPDLPSGKLGQSISITNSFTEALPGDVEERNFVRRVEKALWSHVLPTPVSAPALLAVSDDCAALVGLSAEELKRREAVEILAGNRLVDGFRPYAQAYGGHQFGAWAGQLGDGRAITIAEVQKGNLSYELQLKGAGKTPYSRFADGRAVLRSSLREYVCSEAMHYLGIPTSRALSLVTTGDQVLRDMFYDGNIKPEPGAVVCRVAPSFIRFGTFELLASRGDDSIARELADYTIRRFFPEIPSSAESRYADMFQRVVASTASTVAKWQGAGFVHGVLNTDNMSVLGLTIDYGPFGFVDTYDPLHVPNTTDQGGRYAFSQQPTAALWNLQRFAIALVHMGLLAVDEAQEALDAFDGLFQAEHRELLRRKMGFAEWEGETDANIVREFYDMLEKAEYDMTITHRRLARVPSVASESEAEELSDGRIDELLAHLTPPFVQKEPVQEARLWLRQYLARTCVERNNLNTAERADLMNAANPWLTPRNHILQKVIEDAERGKCDPLHDLLRAISQPYDAAAEEGALATESSYTAPAPAWAKRRGVAKLSCSS